MKGSIAISKSSRHAKLIGDYGEALICNWLSRSAFEIVVVDHTGIDLVAYHRPSKRRLGISVKSRTRVSGTEEGAVYLFRETKNDRQKVLDACLAFGCEPWIAMYIESESDAHLFLTSLENYDQKYRKQGKVVDAWSMRRADREKYEHDPEVRHIHIQFSDNNWVWNSLTKALQRTA